MRAFWGWLWVRTKWDFAASLAFPRAASPPTEDGDERRDIAWFRGDCAMADTVYPEECCDEPDSCREIAEGLRAKDEAAFRAELERRGFDDSCT